MGTEDDAERPGLDRRRMLKLGGAAVAAGWVAPVVLAVPASAATGSGIPVNPLCDGQTCGSFTGDCFPNNPGNCFCYSTPIGSGICETGQLCVNLTLCPSGQSDCPPGTVCCVNTCCFDPVCIVLTDQCGNLPVGASHPNVSAPVGASGPTTAHR